MIAGFIRPRVLWRGLFVGRPFLSHWSSAVMITLSGLMVEPLAWLQSLLIRRQLRARQLPPEASSGAAPARWLDQNRRTLHRYQALVRTAVTLDALVDAEDAPQDFTPG